MASAIRDAYLELALAIVKQAAEDIKAGPRGKKKGYYRTAMGFTRSDLFRLICDTCGVPPDLARRVMVECSPRYRRPAAPPATPAGAGSERRTGMKL